jgi:hypothetical protein
MTQMAAVSQGAMGGPLHRKIKQQRRVSTVSPLGAFASHSGSKERFMSRSARMYDENPHV